MKLTNKIHVFTTVLFIVLLVLINAAIYFSFSRIMYDSELEQTKAQAEQVQAGISAVQSAAAPQDLLRAYVPPGGMITIVQADDRGDARVTGGNGQRLAEEETEFYPDERDEIRSIEGIPHAFISLPIVWTEGEVAALQLTESLQATAENLNVLRIVLLVVSIAAIIPLFISARILSKLITKPILSLIQTMNDIRGSGRFQQIERTSRSKDELDQMTQTFNQMIGQLETNYEKQEQFVSNASHELKTPLTIIESYASLLKRRGKNDEALFDESVEAIHSEALRMRDLTQQLLLLAKQDEQGNVILSSQVLSPILEAASSSFERAYQRQVTLHVKEEMVVKTDAQKLKQLMYILLDNARKYSEEKIVIHAFQKDDRVKIQIKDTGIGISSEHLNKVFDRFYQVDQARTSSSGGYGLGLSLAKELARVLEAEITLTSEQGKGTTATILLPIAN
ncbi:HAMP domain-containing sensor histidine kinase [Jeotgalibacillus sp. ET6]|uniref:sensor histidine kinase n=1 Tax=Jeotgalibacillus sp. ET6 TaxID=3037260 RepID=UPI0024188E2F|nr:HAMP domain-containing sensor histidine kinase [Jeotgalibacillus sp. ET6]MDG5471227.1 HAMP domain-containing sensor histidine kinase [Jeotgalibacillus sp. ET6]